MKDLITEGKKNKDIQLDFITALVICALGALTNRKKL